jgi:hypothetical protein
MKPVDCVEEKQRADPFVKIVPVPPEIIQRRALGQQFGGGKGGAPGVKRLMPRRGVGGRDER